MKLSEIVLTVFFLFCLNAFGTDSLQKCGEVNLFIGTGGDHGQVDPAACVPFGMVRVCPDMDPRSHSGYDYNVSVISGFTVNRLSGIGCSGAGGNIRVKPVPVSVEPTIRKETEKAVPGYYSVVLKRGIRTEFTATRNVALERFFYPAEAEKVMTLDMTAGFEKVRDYECRVVSKREIRGYVVSGNTCNQGQYKLYFDLLSDHGFTVFSNKNGKMEFMFEKTGINPVELRIALSPIDGQTAWKQNKRILHRSFESVRKSAAAKWENLLNSIDVEGGNSDERTFFYTSLYRVFLSPENVSSFDGRYLSSDGKVRKAKGFTYYSSWSMWDSYRTKFPLIALLKPEVMKNICLSLNRLYIYGKMDWATSYESTPTVRTEHSASVILDAYSKGIKSDIKEAYSGYVREAASLQAKRPDQAFETSIDWWAIGRLARLCGKKFDSAEYMEKSKKLFLKTWSTSFKNIDSTFVKMKGSGLYQGTKWQYRWTVPQYLDLMAITSGGKKVLLSQLDEYFGRHLNNQTNEPGLHNPYLYNRLGEPWKTQKIVREILTDEMVHLYGGNEEFPIPVKRKVFENSPEGFLPEMDEDDGTMSAYYVFGSIGLYPLIVGEPWYEISSPLYDRIIVRLAKKKKLVIETKHRRNADDPIKKVFFNGNEIKNFRIDHNEIVKRGGVLLLEY